MLNMQVLFGCYLHDFAASCAIRHGKREGGTARIFKMGHKTTETGKIKALSDLASNQTALFVIAIIQIMLPFCCHGGHSW